MARLSCSCFVSALLVVLASMLSACGDDRSAPAKQTIPAKTAEQLTPLTFIEKYEKEAMDGDAVAQYNLGGWYYYGDGVRQDFVKAVAWWRKAAENDVLDAMYNLGQCYFEGEGVAQDYAQALAWWRKAAKESAYLEDRGESVFNEYGYSKAQWRLGLCYFYGKGVKQDYTQAVKWFRAAVEEDFFRIGGTSSEAQFYLGICYADGLGVTKDLVQSASWYRKAAEKGLDLAQNRTGLCYSEGKGVAKDDVQAAVWFRKAAEQGYSDSQFALGICYGSGRGVLKDSVESYAYVSLAGVTSEGARAYLSSFEKKLSRDEVVAGQKRSKELQKEIEAKIAAKKAGK